MGFGGFGGRDNNCVWIIIIIIILLFFFCDDDCSVTC
ncbi:hypothetical protein SPFL3102_03610 [Sporomusaceae bacterium FL31]|jgi:hypothetical protein|nr:hypothetical protein SPFL3101_00395 [Sporomusaceae bacterium FL31]GCE35758.1 hypothetical protein SPFL3102_03610 [Sporomusaceae bacterium]